MSEDPLFTWDKRYKQRHYSYRDYHSASTQVLTELQALAQALSDLQAGNFASSVLYVFGTNARMTVNPYTLAEPTPSVYGYTAWPENCYAREVLVYCTQDAWIKIVSLNPEYVRQATLETLTKVKPTAPQLIFEREMFIPSGDYMLFRPTYGYAIVFRADSVGGTIRIWVEGNVEGGE